MFVPERAIKECSIIKHRDGDTLSKIRHHLALRRMMFISARQRSIVSSRIRGGETLEQNTSSPGIKGDHVFLARHKMILSPIIREGGTLCKIHHHLALRRMMFVSAQDKNIVHVSSHIREGDTLCY